MRKTVVYFADSTTLGGTEQALLHLLAGLDRERWEPMLFHVMEHATTPLVEKAQRLNAKTKAVPRLQGLGTVAGLPEFVRQLRLERPAVFHAHLNWLLSCKYGLLAAALARGEALASAMQWANAAAALSVTRHGAIEGIPARAEVAALLN